MHLAIVQDTTGVEQPAEAAVALWRDVWIALSPIIGAAGAAALYERSLFLAIAEYSWLKNVSDSPESGDFNALRRELALQTRADAAAANAALLNSLAQVLGKLIGASLAARLLQPVWEKHGHTTQDGSTRL
jgi:hypothetical protein